MLKFFTALIVGMSTVVYAEDEKPAQPARARWDAQADLQALQGYWKMVSEVDQDSFDFFTKQKATAISIALYREKSELKFDKQQFAIPQAKLSGKFQNDMNQIEFLPEKFWLNTQEPKLRFTLEDGTTDEVSYVVKGDSLRFRYPAKSCSRSGVQFSFVRLHKNP